MPVRVLGPAARLALPQGAVGRVLAVFRRSFYVEMQDGALACLGPASLGAGPLNVLYELPEVAGLPSDWATAGLTAGDPVRVQGHTLHVDERWHFDLQATCTWSPAPVAEPDALGLASGRALLAEVCAGSPAPRGLGRLLPALLAGSAASEQRPGVDGMLLRTALKHTRTLMAWLSDCTQPASLGSFVPPSELLDLLGLGPGLTPAGDDLLGGALVALHALGQSGKAAQLAGHLLPHAAARTGRISGAHLACAAQGWGADALHDALAALAAGDRIALHAAVQQLDAIGHTSGWDALTGAAALWVALAGVPRLTAELHPTLPC